MRAAIFRKGQIVVGEVSEPKPREGQVLVKTLACGICGTDLHARLHAERFVRMSDFVKWRKPMDLKRDVVFGHEFCCEVLDYGPGTERRLKPGTRVVSVPRIMVGGEQQGIGYSNDNIGAYAERMLLSERFMLPVPDHLPSQHASLTEPLAVGVHAVAKAGMRGGEAPLVIGCGPVGLAVIAALKRKRRSLDFGPIVAADFSPKRRETARRLGADVVVDPKVASPWEIWRNEARLSAAEIARLPSSLNPVAPLRPQLVFECVGVPGVIQSIFESAEQGAKTVIVGVCMETDRSEPMYAIFKELSVQYVLAYTVDEFAEALAMLADGEVDAGALITGSIGLADVAEAFDALANPEVHTKIIVEPWR
jgi:threonine dehydrogenase-like Zn-dependent dehydrogenase